MNDQIGLMVRRSVRHEISLPGEFCIDEVHAEAIRFGPGSAHRGGWCDCTIADIGSGGIGFMSSVFVPRGAHLKVRVFRLGGGDLLAECSCVVRRVIMTDSRPGYLVGTSYVTGVTDDRAQIDQLIAALEEDGGVMPQGAPGEADPIEGAESA